MDELSLKIENDDTVDSKVSQVFTDDEVSDFFQIFSLYDMDNDGRIAFNEIPTILKAIGMTQSTDDLIASAASTGTSSGYGRHNTACSFDEFLHILVRYRQKVDDDADLKEAFRLFDKDADGFLTSKDLKHVMLNFGEKLTDDEIGEMIDEADLDRDGKINYEEFAAMMKRHD